MLPIGAAEKEPIFKYFTALFFSRPAYPQGKLGKQNLTFGDTTRVQLRLSSRPLETSCPTQRIMDIGTGYEPVNIIRIGD